MCALTNSTKQCANTDFEKFGWHAVSTLFTKRCKNKYKNSEFLELPLPMGEGWGEG
jgi:hypothetical protein